MSASLVETKTVQDAVSAACRAPSIHNIQPWQWVLETDELRLYLDRNRVLPSDGAGREAVIGCGAALDHLRVAMSAAGLNSNVERFPNPNDLDHLASIQFSPMSYVTDGHRSRADAIWARRSDRLPLDPPPEGKSPGVVGFREAVRPGLKVPGVSVPVLGWAIA